MAKFRKISGSFIGQDDIEDYIKNNLEENGLAVVECVAKKSEICGDIRYQLRVDDDVIFGICKQDGKVKDERIVSNKSELNVVIAEIVVNGRIPMLR